MLSTDAVARAADRRLLERLIGLNTAAVSQWEVMARQVKDERVRDLLEKTVFMQRRISARLEGFLPEFLQGGGAP